MRRADLSASLAPGQSAVADTGVKAMIPIGRPFLDYVLSALADAAYERVCLVIGPEHATVRHYYTVASPPKRLSIHFAIQEKPLGTADALLAAEEFCGAEPFIVLNSDNYYPMEALRELRVVPPPAIAAFPRSVLIADGNVPPDRVGRFGALTIDEHDSLVSITPKTGEPSRDSGEEVYASMNCWSFDSRIFEACRRVPVSPRNELELPRAVQLAIDKLGMQVKVIRISQAVLDLSSRGDIAAVQQRLASVKVTV